MQLHQLKPTHKNKDKKRVGRGGKRGAYSGRGMKGQKSRSGHNMQPVIRELIKRYPKLKGYRRASFAVKALIVNLNQLESAFSANDKVNPKTLLEKGLVSALAGKITRVKILASGEIKKPLTIEDCDVSATAKEKIEKAGGVVKLKMKNEKVKTTEKN
ncbi:MAG: 50S ribosomal protein L15 [Patescibacteria group bacterium]